MKYFLVLDKSLIALKTIRLPIKTIATKNKVIFSKRFIISPFFAAPSSFPQNLTGLNISSKSIMVRWFPVPPRHQNGIVRHYKVSYVKFPPGIANETTVIVSGNQTNVNITSLEKFTNYSIRIAAFTIDYGNFSHYVVVSSGEDGKILWALEMSHHLFVLCIWI